MILNFHSVWCTVYSTIHLDLIPDNLQNFHLQNFEASIFTSRARASLQIKLNVFASGGLCACVRRKLAHAVEATGRVEVQ